MQNIAKKVYNMSKINNIEIAEYPVSFPFKEKAYALVTHDGIPFRNAVLGITNPTANYSICRHNSNLCLFEYILEGEGEIFIDGEWHSAAAGDFYILPSGIDHVYRSSETNPWKKLWVNYYSDYMQQFLAAYGIRGGIYHSESVREYFEELISLTKSGADEAETAIRVADRLHRIVRIAALLNKNAKDDEYGMRRLLSTYVHKKLNLDELAEALHMSKSSLIRIFKKTYGVTPYEYLIEQRLETAKILLKDTKLTIKEIADKLVFFDEHYFSSIFLKKVGVRPGVYRKTDSDA